MRRLFVFVLIFAPVPRFELMLGFVCLYFLLISTEPRYIVSSIWMMPVRLLLIFSVAAILLVLFVVVCLVRFLLVLPALAAACLAA